MEWGSHHAVVSRIQRLTASAVSCLPPIIIHFAHPSLPPSLLQAHYGTLVYRRGVWEAEPFRDKSLGEDYAFAGTAVSITTSTLPIPTAAVAVPASPNALTIAALTLAVHPSAAAVSIATSAVPISTSTTLTPAVSTASSDSPPIAAERAKRVWLIPARE